MSMAEEGSVMTVLFTFLHDTFHSASIGTQTLSNGNKN
jgi:hypothetical protein